MAYENILVEKNEGIATIFINRPKAMNALNAETLFELGDAIKDIAADDEVGAVIVTGSGDKSFVAGADITFMYPLDGMKARYFSGVGQAVFRQLEKLEKPVIAAINGFALGGGCELAMACDIRLASTTALFGQPEVGLGIPPGFGGTQRLSRLVGEGRALELILTANNIKADEAYRIGLVNHLYAPEELMEQARKMAKKIMSNAPTAVAISKSAIYRGLQTDIDTAMAIEADNFGLTYLSANQKEGMGAYMEKRKPTWVK